MSDDKETSAQEMNKVQPINGNQPMKGFRQAPEPSKGKVMQENNELKNHFALLDQQIRMIGMVVTKQAETLKDLRTSTLGVAALMVSSTSFEDPSGAQAGDNLLVDYMGTMLKDDGTPDLDADGTPANLDNLTAIKTFIFNLGAGTLIPGFEEQVVGMKAGEAKEINLTFPEKYYAPALSNRKAKFLIHVHQIHRPMSKSPVEITYDQYREAKANEKARQEAAKQAESAPAPVTSEAPTAQTETTEPQG